MATIKDALTDMSTRALLIEDCTKLIDDEVEKKSGLSGVAIKTGYKLVKGLKPGFISEATDKLIDAFSERLQPIVDEAHEKGQGVAAYFESERSRVAEAMLSITDQRAEGASHKAVQSMYLKLRPTAKKHVEQAASGVGRLFEKYSDRQADTQTNK